MPIMPEDRWLYLMDWRELSALVRFSRAKGVCERCGQPHGQAVTHLGDGIWWDTARAVWRDGRGKRVRGLLSPETFIANQPWLATFGPWPQLPVIRVVLATAHRDHDPGNNRMRDLAALCQRCHMLHDAPGHQRTRWRNAHLRRAAGNLFGYGAS